MPKSNFDVSYRFFGIMLNRKILTLVDACGSVLCLPWHKRKIIQRNKVVGEIRFPNGFIVFQNMQTSKSAKQVKTRFWHFSFCYFWCMIFRFIGYGPSAASPRHMVFLELVQCATRRPAGRVHQLPWCANLSRICKTIMSMQAVRVVCCPFWMHAALCCVSHDINTTNEIP